MSAPVEALFQPFRLGALELPTRVVMAPMTRNFSPGGVPNAKVVEYYRRRRARRGGAGGRRRGAPAERVEFVVAHDAQRLAGVDHRVHP
ncbi:hypothetical protein OFL47_29460, partial [Pseudomonas aeruginosa]|nr:hypothetical protein [Pseudomonas aeruginosa]